MSVDDRPTLHAPDDDPWLWLEEIEGTQALDFVERQNSLTLQAFGGAAFQRDRDLLAAIYDRPDNIPYVSRRGSDLHNLWKDTTNPRGLWRRTSLAEFRKSTPAWDVMLDIDQLARDESEDWRKYLLDSALNRRLKSIKDAKSAGPNPHATRHDKTGNDEENPV